MHPHWLNGPLRRNSSCSCPSKHERSVLALLRFVLQSGVGPPVLSWKRKIVSCSVMSDSFRSHGLQPAKLYPWDPPGKNTGVGCRSLLQGTFPTWVLNLGLLHCRWIFLLSGPPGKPIIPYFPSDHHLPKDRGSLFHFYFASSWAWHTVIWAPQPSCRQRGRGPPVCNRRDSSLKPQLCKLAQPPRLVAGTWECEKNLYNTARPQFSP